MVSVVSFASAVAPSNTIALAAFIVTVSTTVCVPFTVKFPVTVKLSPIVTSDVVCPIVTGIPLVYVAIFNVPVELAMREFVPSCCICRSSPVPNFTMAESGISK